MFCAAALLAGKIYYGSPPPEDLGAVPSRTGDSEAPTATAAPRGNRVRQETPPPARVSSKRSSSPDYRRSQSPAVVVSEDGSDLEEEGSGPPELNETKRGSSLASDLQNALREAMAEGSSTPPPSGVDTPPPATSLGAAPEPSHQDPAAGGDGPGAPHTLTLRQILASGNGDHGLFVPCTASGQSSGSINTPLVTQTYFFTTFKQKFEEVQKVLGSHSITQCFIPDLPTFEDMELTQLAEKRVGLLYERLKRPCFLEECSLEIEDLGFPGHAFRYIQKNKRYMRQWAQENCGKSCTIRIAVGYADYCGQVSVFETSGRGTIAVPPTEEGWNVGIGWDPIWAPEGFRGLTISQMLPHKHFVDTRLQLYLSLRELLVRFEDNLVVYEVHLTMCLPMEAKSDLTKLLEFKERFEEACVAESQRPLTVLEDHGEGKRQIQFQTAQYRCFEDVKSACEWARVLSTTFHEKHNCPVARMRVEGMAYSKATPKTKAEGRRAHPDAYFEFHLRLGVNVDPELVAAARSIAAHHRKRHVDPHISMVGVKTFLNCRFYAPVALDEADAKFDTIVAELVERCKFEPKKKTLKEYCVYDDDMEFDEDPDNPTVVQEAVFRGLQQHLLSSTFASSISPSGNPAAEPENESRLSFGDVSGAASDPATRLAVQ